MTCQKCLWRVLNGMKKIIIIIKIIFMARVQGWKENKVLKMPERAMLTEITSEWKEWRCLISIPLHMLFSKNFLYWEQISLLEKLHCAKNLETINL